MAFYEAVLGGLETLRERFDVGERSVTFYEAVLGVDERERVGRYASLTLGGHHHKLALQAVGGDGDDNSDDRDHGRLGL